MFRTSGNIITKVIRRALQLPLIFIAIPCVLLVRVLSPWVLFRFLRFSWDRIGNLYRVWWNLVDKPGEHAKRRVVDIVYPIDFGKAIANVAWLRLVSRRVYIFPWPRLAAIVDRVNQLFPGHERYRVMYSHPPSLTTVRNIFSRQEPTFPFSSAEEIEGAKGAKDLGLGEGEQFICFHTRDSAYLNITYPEGEWSYHDYRDAAIVNSYHAVKSYLERRPFRAFRVGAVVAEAIQSHPRIIDYSRSELRSDLMDLYLSAKCRFFVGGECGATIFPESFRRPVVYANWAVNFILPSFYYDKGLFILKKWYSVKENRLLTFKEINALSWNSALKLSEWGVRLLENTPEEILDVMMEMDQRLDHAWEGAPGDDELQRRFWWLYGKTAYDDFTLRVGTKFLRDNVNLLS